MNHDCENCHHYNFLIHHEAGVFYQCFLGHKLWEDCNDFDAEKEDERMSAERYMVDDAGTVIDKVTLDNYELASEMVSILNNYENTLNELTEDNEQLRKRVKELELVNDGLNYALKNIKKIDVEIDVGDDKMTENKRFVRLISSIDYYYCLDKENDDKGLTEADMLNMLNDLSDENEELKQLFDLCASDICRLVKILSDYNIDYELQSDVTNFITKWGVRIE